MNISIEVLKAAEKGDILMKFENPDQKRPEVFLIAKNDPEKEILSLRHVDDEKIRKYYNEILHENGWQYRSTRRPFQSI